MSETTASFNQFLNRAEANQTAFELSKKELQRNFRKAQRDLRGSEQAMSVLQAATIATQTSIRFHLQEIATKALQVVFADAYEIQLSFDIKRKQSEVVIQLVQNGRAQDPLESTGGGVVDVIGLAMRLSLWSMKRPRPMPFFSIDEPFRNLSNDHQQQVGCFLFEMCEGMGMQMLLVTHRPNIIKYSNRLWLLEKQPDGTRATQEI